MGMFVQLEVVFALDAVEFLMSISEDALGAIKQVLVVPQHIFIDSSHSAWVRCGIISVRLWNFKDGGS